MVAGVSDAAAAYTGQGYHTGSRHRLVGLPVLKEYEQYLQQLLNAPPLQPLETGMQMMRTADTLWPESLQQQEASRMWSNTLRNRAQASPQMKGWQQARQNLRDFADLMMKKETEKQGFTLSYIKTVTGRPNGY